MTFSLFLFFAYSLIFKAIPRVFANGGDGPFMFEVKFINIMFGDTG